MEEAPRDAGVQARFNRLALHDARLVGLRLSRRAEERVDDLLLSIELPAERPGEGRSRDVTLTFLDCTYLKVDVDLGFKNVSDDAISAVECLDVSLLREHLEREVMGHEVDPLREYWEFVVHLCPPGGRLHVFARTFRLG